MDFKAKTLEKVTKTKSLTDEIENKRSKAKVIKLATRGYPNEYFQSAESGDGVDPIFHKDSYGEKELIGVTGHDNNLSLYRKAFPHCLYGMMAIKTFNKDEVSIVDFCESERRDFYTVAKNFADYCEGRNLYPNISWTYDPLTRDRKSGQSKLWYHMHLNSHTEQEKEVIEAESTPLRDYRGKETKRSFIDEFSIVFSLVLKDYFDNSPLEGDVQVFAPFEHEGLPNFSVTIDGGWQSLLDKTFDANLLKIHTIILRLYDEFQKLLFSGNANHWERPERNGKTVPFASYPWLTHSTHEAMNVFLESLSTAVAKKLLEKFKSHPKSDVTSHVYPLAGASYATTITKTKDGALLLSIRPQMFSDTGAAGLHYAFGSNIKLARGSESYTNEELANKATFEEELMKYLKTVAPPSR